MEFAKDFWRGIPNSSFISNNRLSAQAFQFDDNPDRTDSYRELSINWNDEPESLEVLLSQRKEKDDQIQFKAGAARIEVANLKLLFSSFIFDNSFKYERSPLPNNRFHGNLLIKSGLDKPERTMIQNGLALLANNNKMVPNPNI